MELSEELVPGRPAVNALATTLTPPASARFGVISDIDDTVLITQVRRPAQMLRAMLFENARTRLPFPGAAPLYQALHGGGDEGGPNPVFYISSGSWNLYRLLEEFLDFRGFLHLVSHNESIPQITFTLRDGELSGWSSDGAYFGQKYFIGSAKPVGTNEIDAAIQRFAACILAFDDAR